MHFVKMPPSSMLPIYRYPDHRKERISQHRASQTMPKRRRNTNPPAPPDTAIQKQSLARDPNTYVGKKTKFTGKVIQVSEGLGSTVMRVNVTQGKYSWDDSLYVTYTPNQDRYDSPLFQDDIVTIDGEMQPLKTYTTVYGCIGIHSSD